MKKIITIIMVVTAFCLNADAGPTISGGSSASINDSGTGTSDILSAAKIYEQLALKQATLSGSVDITVKSVTIAKSSGVAGNMCVYEANGTDTNMVCFRGPASRSSDLYLQFADADPAANQFLLYPAPTAGVSTGVWTTYGQFGTLDVLTTGTISGKIPTVVNSDTASYNVSLAQVRACTFFLTTNTATTTYTLPAAEAGACACFKMGQGNAQVLRIDTDGTDYIVMSTGARTSAAGDYYGASSSATNQICVAAFDTTDWYVTSTVGTWTEE